MKKLPIIAILLAFIVSLLSANMVEASTRVRGYTKKNGTYIQPHQRSSPNRTKIDNYSTKGNYNPYTGKKGSSSPYKTYKYR